MAVFSIKTQLYCLIYELYVSATVGSDDQAIPKNIKGKKHYSCNNGRRSWTLQTYYIMYNKLDKCIRKN